MAQPGPSDPMYDLDDRTDPEFAAIFDFVMGDRLQPPKEAIHNFEKFKERRSPDRICRAAHRLQEQNRGAEVLAYVRDLLGIMRPALPKARRKRDRIIEAYLAGLDAKQRKTQQRRIERGKVQSPLKDTIALLSEATDLVVSRAAKVVSWLRYEELPCLAPLNDHHPELIAGVTGVISGHATEQNWERIEAAYATADIAWQRGALPSPKTRVETRERYIRLSVVANFMKLKGSERATMLKNWRERFYRRGLNCKKLPIELVLEDFLATGDITANVARLIREHYQC